ncbi:MAG: NADH-dependent flavin oxidoreductase [Clostridia bacterium]|nr:NADH-dependent flavin oxidoreductase [Clostridia bacterium]
MNTLFETFEIKNNIFLRNKFVMAPMTTWSSHDNGRVDIDELKYYSERAKEVGMVITATTYMEPHGKGFQGQFFGGDDAYLDSLTALSNTIKEQGAKAILQVFHAGRKAHPEMMPDGIIRSASNVPGNRVQDNIPQAMTDEEIQKTIKSFYDVTIRAYEAGFDGIEIHGANTYLIQQFFSPHSNIREDIYGGSLEKRLTFPLAIVKATLKARKDMNHEDFIIGYRFSPEENHTPGICLEDTTVLLDALCATNIDYLHVSLSHYAQTSIREENSESILPILVKVINHRKPLIGVGSIYSLKDAENLLDMGVELVAMGRQLLIDPHTVGKWANHRVAFEKYDASKREALAIPEKMEKVLLSQAGWLPTVR